jgi:Tfp pilus assembly protein PilN
MTPGRLELDYVAAPKAPRWVGVAVLAVALAVAGSLVLRLTETQRQLAALDAAQGLLNADRRPQRAVPRERLEQEAKIIDAAVRQLTLPWAQMIEAVEGASSKDVVVLQLQPEAQQRTLRLTAEAKDGDAMLRYVRRLGENRVLSAVYLASHQVQMEEPSRPIQFSVQASFRSGR